jgi:hypothetical protein
MPSPLVVKGLFADVCRTSSDTSGSLRCFSTPSQALATGILITGYYPLSSGQRKSCVKQRLKVNAVENPRVRPVRNQRAEGDKLKQGLSEGVALRKAKTQIHVL